MIFGVKYDLGMFLEGFTLKHTFSKLSLYLIGISWHCRCFCQFPSRSLYSELALPLLSAIITSWHLFLIKDFCSRDCYFSRQPRNLLLSSTCDAQTGSGAARAHRSLSRFALPLLTVRSEKRKDVSVSVTETKKEEAPPMTQWSALADVAGIPPARAAIWGSPAEYSRRACC